MVVLVVRSGCVEVCRTSSLDVCRTGVVEVSLFVDVSRAGSVRVRW